MSTNLLLWFALACQESQPAPDGVMVIAKEDASVWIRNFNPFSQTGAARWPTRSGIYEPMMIYTPISGAYEPWLAIEYSWNSDATTLRMALREDVLWSDGEPFDADDVKFTFDLFVKHPAMDTAGLRSQLSSIEKLNSSELLFHFSKPSFSGLEKIAHQPIVPEHLWKDISNPLTYDNPNPVGTGPFTEVRHFESQLWELGRNPYSWAKPAVEALRFPALPNNQQATLALLQGEVDWAGKFIPAVDRIFVARSPETNHYWYPLMEASVLLYPNTQRSPFDLPEVRKAISMALNRSQIVKIAMHGYTQPADVTGLSPAFADWSIPIQERREKWTDFNVEEAERLLDEAGLLRNAKGLRCDKNGEPLSWRIGVVSGWDDWVRAALVVASNLSALGIDARVDGKDFGAWFEQLQKGNFDLSIGWSEIGQTPASFYQMMLSQKQVKPIGEASTSNWHRFASSSADRHLAALEATPVFEEQRRLIQKLQAEFIEQAPAIPLFLNPSWGQYNTARFENFPSAENPYARLSPNHSPENLLVLTRVKPK